MTKPNRSIALSSLRGRREALMLFSHPLGADTELLHPTPAERTAIRLASIEDSNSLLNAEEQRARGREDALDLVCFLSFLGSFFLVAWYMMGDLSPAALALAATSASVSALSYFGSESVRRRKQEARRLAAYPAWPALLCSSCDRLAAAGAQIPSSILDLVSRFKRCSVPDVQARILAECGERDTLLMLRFAHGVAEAAAQCPGNLVRLEAAADNLPIVRLGGDTEELLSRVREALPGVELDKPREFLL